MENRKVIEMSISEDKMVFALKFDILKILNDDLKFELLKSFQEALKIKLFLM